MPFNKITITIRNSKLSGNGFNKLVRIISKVLAKSRESSFQDNCGYTYFTLADNFVGRVETRGKTELRE